ncbi:MAG: hypothetical protein M1827_004135 [Pycnora praestabilis]|nr:MAG: hypothetical protein M1827_004135 [Pycnora praestabilis]
MTSIPSNTDTQVRTSSIKSNRSRLQKGSNRKAGVSPERASTPGAAFRRGDLKISGPISLPNDNDEELPLRSAAISAYASPNTSKNNLQVLRQASLSGSMATRSIPAPGSSQHKQSNSFGRGGSNTEDIVAYKLPAKVAPHIQPHNVIASQSPNIKLSQARKEKGFRAAIRKLFGRKPKRVIPTDVLSGPKHQLRDLGAATETTPRDYSNHDLHKSVSLPLNMISPSAPLGSHSLRGPKSPESPPNTQNPKIEPPTESSAEQSTNLRYIPTRARRATLPSVIFSPEEATAITTSWNRLDQGTASEQETGLKMADLNNGESGIGFAITSGGNPNRRSRSAGALQLTARDQDPLKIARRRSDEIDYWRETFSVKHIAQLASPQAQDPRTSDIAREPPPETIRYSQEEPSLPDSPDPQEEPQAIAFACPIAGTEGSNLVSENTIEFRLSKLENRLSDSEHAISRLHGRASRSTVIIERTPERGQRQRSTSSKASSYSQPRYSKEQEPPVSELPGFHDRHLPKQPSMTSFDDSPTSTISYPQALPPAFLSLGNRPHEPGTPYEHRPISTSTTIRAPTTSDPSDHPPPLPTGLTSEHYTTLLSLIKREQSARRRLEHQVISLQREMEELRSRSPEAMAYPTPSPDLPAPSSSHQQADVSRGRFAGFDATFLREDSGMIDDDEYQSSDLYETPTEEKQHEFPHVMGEGEMERPSTRTLATRGRHVEGREF